MFLLNLLSPEEKNNISKIKTYYVLRSISFRFISLVLIIVTIFIFSYFLLSNQKKLLTEQINKEIALRQEGKVSAVEEATSELNKQLNLANEIQLNYIKWTDFIKTYSSAMVEGITLTNLNFNTTGKILTINGTAQSRSTLLKYQQNLEELDYFSDIDMPISNLIQKENINFEITGNLTDNIYE